MVANKIAVFLFCFYFVLIFSRLSLVSAPAFGDWNVASSQQCHQEGEAASGMRQNSPCFIIVASSIYGSDLLLLWAHQPCASPYRPTRTFSSRNVLIAILLLSSGNIESNPGPPSRTTSNKTKLPMFINFGCLNVRSAVHKVASIHDIIKDFRLNIFALQETWISADAPPAIKDDIAPAGYSCLHVCRESHGGGLGLICRNDVFVKQFSVSDVISPKSFEVQVVKITPTVPRRLS